MITTLSADLKRAIPGATGFSRINLYYTKRFYSLYSKLISFVPQAGEQLSKNGGIEIVPQLGEQFKTDIDNPTIGLLVCKDKDNIVARYALESYTQPIGVSEFRLADIYPTDFHSSMPTIEEIEARLGEMTDI